MTNAMTPATTPATTSTLKRPRATIGNLQWAELSKAEQLALRDPDIGKFLKSLPPEQAAELQYDWTFWGRPDQQWPEGEWSNLVLCAGRGSGKSKTGSELTRERVRRAGDQPLRMGLFGPTPFDVRVFMIEGDNGLLAVHPESERPIYEPTKRQVRWPRTGSVATIFTGADPEAGRGPTLDFAWADEIQKWKYGPSVFANMRMALRGGNNPQSILTFTPKPFKLIRDIVGGRFPGTIVRRQSLYRNIANLAPQFIQEMLSVYEGTTLGRQEIYGEIVEDVEGALWTFEMIEDVRTNYRPEKFSRVVVGVDPSSATTIGTPGMGRECGIIVAGLGYDGLVYILDDRSMHATPARWGMEAVLAYLEWDADAIVMETNFGLAMGRQVIRTVQSSIERILLRDEDSIHEEFTPDVISQIKDLGMKASQLIHVQEVHASRGKRARAEPVVGLFEQKRVKMVGVFPLLEQQMTSWIPPEFDGGVGYSPDRIDALAWAVTTLGVNGGASSVFSAARSRLPGFMPSKVS